MHLIRSYLVSNNEPFYIVPASLVSIERIPDDEEIVEYEVTYAALPTVIKRVRLHSINLDAQIDYLLK